MENFVIILFKNKKKKKIIKGYVTIKNAKLRYNKLVKENNVPFNVVYENGSECKYEIALLSKHKTEETSLFKSDEFGRNKRVFVEDNEEYQIIKINDYRVEELIYDCQLNKRINFNIFLETYFKNKEMKVISTLHNKIVLQIDSEFFLFTLKNSTDSNRFISVVEEYFINMSRNDCIFVRDIDTIQRKWLYNCLEEYGFNKTQLYRQVTTYPRQT